MAAYTIVETIISGGQTGVDRAALDAAAAYGIETGGYVPRGRIAEDGPLPERYRGMVETESADPAERTRLNVLTADGTLIVSRGELTGGSALTREEAETAGKKCCHIDLNEQSLDEAVEAVRTWLQETRPSILNVAGPRSSEDPEIYGLALRLLRGILCGQEKEPNEK